MSERRWLVVVILLAALLAGVAIFWKPEWSHSGSTASPLPAGGDFTVNSADGPVSLKDFRGRWTLLYFGYTFCPDICPTSLAATARALSQLSAEEREKVAVLFVSVDPERDTPGHLKEYARFFDENMLGATAAPEVLAEIARRYGVFYARAKVETAGGGYVVDHTADTFVIDPAGRLVGKLVHGTAPAEIAASLRQSMNSQPRKGN